MPVAEPSGGSGAYRAHECTWRVIPGYFVAADLSGSSTEIAGPGGEIWELLIAGLTVDEVVTALDDQYATQVEVIRPDVETFVAQMLERNLLARVT